MFLSAAAPFARSRRLRPLPGPPPAFAGCALRLRARARRPAKHGEAARGEIGCAWRRRTPADPPRPATASASSTPAQPTAGEAGVEAKPKWTAVWPAELGKKPLEADSGPLDVLAEDDRLLVVLKPPGLAFQPRNRWITGTLVNRVVHRLGRDPHVVHRLDQGTSGVAVFAKDYEAVRDLHKQFLARTVDKDYLAVVAGQPPSDSFRVEAAIERLEGSKFRRCVRADGKYGATDFEVLRAWPDALFDGHAAPPEDREGDPEWEKPWRRVRGAALLRCVPQTGRTHQIRIHAAHVGLPLLGDQQYGVLCPDLIGRQALHASRLRVRHPGTREEVEYVAPTPDDFVALFAALDALQAAR